MAASRTPKPVFETEDIDESWDAFASTEDQDEDEDEDPIFDRQTAVPEVPPEHLAQSPIARRTPVVGARAASTKPAPGRVPRPRPPSDATLEVRYDSLPPDLAELEGSSPWQGMTDESSSVRARHEGSVETGRPPPPPAPSDPAESTPGLDPRIHQLRTAGPPASPPDGVAPAPLELDFGDADMASSPLALVDQSIDPPESEGGAAVKPSSDRPSGPGGGSAADMQDRYAVGDFTGALVIAESILDGDPQDPDALRYAQSCREVLTQMYAARLGPIDQVVTVAVPPEQITWLSLDHRAGFLLSLVDGVSSVEEILDISGMNRLEAMRIMYTLVQQNVITLG